MTPMFYDIIGGRTELLEPVESYIYEDSMGLCGWINNKRVLLGNRDLMLNHSIAASHNMHDVRERIYQDILICSRILGIKIKGETVCAGRNSSFRICCRITRPFFIGNTTIVERCNGFLLGNFIRIKIQKRDINAAYIRRGKLHRYGKSATVFKIAVVRTAFYGRKRKRNAVRL